MIKRHPEPLLWMLFSAGGVMSGMLMPALLFLFGIAFPLGWLRPPTTEHMWAALANPLVALTMFALCALVWFAGHVRADHGVPRAATCLPCAVRTASSTWFTV